MRCFRTEILAVLIEVKEERLDAHNSSEFKSQMLSLFEDGKNNLVIDLKGGSFCRFIRAGCSRLRVQERHCEKWQSQAVWSSASQVKAMFELTRLHRVFEIFPRLQKKLSPVFDLAPPGERMQDKDRSRHTCPQ